MIRIKNDSLQSFEIYFMTDEGAQPYWITPGHAVIVPVSYLTDQIRIMQKRRILKISQAG